MPTSKVPTFVSADQVLFEFAELGIERVMNVIADQVREEMSIDEESREITVPMPALIGRVLHLLITVSQVAPDWVTAIFAAKQDEAVRGGRASQEQLDAMHRAFAEAVTTRWPAITIVADPAAPIAP